MAEAKAATLPGNLDLLGWDDLDFLGWRDAKAPLRAYLIAPSDTEPRGIMLRAPGSRMKGRISAMCALCRSSRPGPDICLFAARRVGPAGRNGDTVGTYICADLACSANVRTRKRTPNLEPDPGLSVEQRIENLRDRVDAFLTEVCRAM